MMLMSDLVAPSLPLPVAMFFSVALLSAAAFLLWGREGEAA